MRWWSTQPPGTPSVSEGMSRVRRSRSPPSAQTSVSHHYREAQATTFIRTHTSNQHPERPLSSAAFGGLRASYMWSEPVDNVPAARCGVLAAATSGD